MGIDALAIKWELEKAFKIRLKSEDMMGIVGTAGDLHAWIYRRLHGNDGRAWAQQQMARIFAERWIAVFPELPVPDLNTPLPAVFAGSNTRAKWILFQRHMGSGWYIWKYSAVTRVAIALCCSGLMVFGALSLFLSDGFRWGVAACALLTILIAIFGPRCLSDRRVKDLCIQLVYEQKQSIKIPPLDHPSAESEAVWKTVVQVLSSVLAVPPEKIRTDSRLVEDLGMA